MSNASSEAIKDDGTHVAVAITRDLDETRFILAKWFAARMPETEAVDVVSLKSPTVGGGSSETFFTTLNIRKGGHTTTQECVVRIKPTHFRLFMRDNFEEQYQLLTYLRKETDIPVPAIPFYERDPSLLGAPFWVMEKVDGQVPPDNPSYNAGGFVFDGTVEQRHKLWRDGLETLVKLSKLDPAKLPPIVALKPGENGRDENLRHWTDSMNWACDGKPSTILRRANDWLWTNKPARGDTGLSWGDARIGNMIFRDWTCAAVLDWETITLAGPQLDLAHWLIMDDYSAGELGLPRLPGLGTRAETIALWEQLTGLKADQLGWHEVLATFRLSVIMVRYGKLWAAAGRLGIIDDEGETLLSRLLHKVLARVAGI